MRRERYFQIAAELGRIAGVHSQSLGDPERIARDQAFVEECERRAREPGEDLDAEPLVENLLAAVYLQDAVFRACRDLAEEMLDELQAATANATAARRERAAALARRVHELRAKGMSPAAIATEVDRTERHIFRLLEERPD